MPVIHKPVFTVKESANGKYRWRVSRNRPTEKGNKLENQITSQLYANKANAERGFKDALCSMLIIADERGILIDAMIETGTLESVNNAL